MFEQYKNNRKTQNLIFSIREAVESDLVEIAGIIQKRQGGDAHTHITGLSSYLNSKSAQLYIAEIKGEIVGYSKSRRYEGVEYSHEGWYLSGLIVKPEFRGAGIGRELTKVRLDGLKPIATKVYYLSNSNNLVSIKLHEEFGFLKKDGMFKFPGVTFENGKGSLFEAVLKIS